MPYVGLSWVPNISSAKSLYVFPAASADEVPSGSGWYVEFTPVITVIMFIPLSWIDFNVAFVFFAVFPEYVNDVPTELFGTPSVNNIKYLFNVVSVLKWALAVCKPASIFVLPPVVWMLSIADVISSILLLGSIMSFASSNVPSFDISEFEEKLTTPIFVLGCSFNICSAKVFAAVKTASFLVFPLVKVLSDILLESSTTKNISVGLVSSSLLFRFFTSICNVTSFFSLSTEISCFITSPSSPNLIVHTLSFTFTSVTSSFAANTLVASVTIIISAIIIDTQIFLFI